MTEVRFYHLTRANLESALPVMLERTLERGQRAVVRTGTEDRAESLSHHLWTYRDETFLPHGTGKDGFPEDQPIWLTAKDETPNDPDVLFLTDGAAASDLGRFKLCAILFDGRDADAVAAARAQWKALADEGQEVTYWQQDENGRWAQKA